MLRLLIVLLLIAQIGAGPGNQESMAPRLDAATYTAASRVLASRSSTHWLQVTYGGTSVPRPSGLPLRIPGYRLTYPRGWTARLWPDTLANFGQLSLSSPVGTTLDLLLIPLEPQGPTWTTLLEQDRSHLTAATQDTIVMPLGRTLRLSGIAQPVQARCASQILYLQRNSLAYRLVATYPFGSPEEPVVRQIVQSLRLANGQSKVPPPPVQPSGETCCHCPAWGTGWGAVLTHINGVPVYWNAGDVDNGCVGTYGILYQCVELVQRYFAQRWGDPTIWRGVGTAADMRWSHPSDVRFIPNGGAPGPQEGDALLFYGGKVGHVGLVQHVDTSRGDITLVEENWSSSGVATVSLAAAYAAATTVGIRQSAYGSYIVAGWLHNVRNGRLTHSSGTRLRTPSRRD